MGRNPSLASAAAYRFWKHALLCLGVFFILAMRAPLLWSSGEFVSEDGWVFFATAFNQPWHESVFVPFAGYFRFDARLLAELFSMWPLASLPVVYAVGGLGLNALILSWFYRPELRRLCASDAGRMGIVVVLALAPHVENLGLLTGLHWYLAFLLVLLLSATPPVTRLGQLAWVLTGSVIVWSSPSVLVLAPWLFYRVWRAPDRVARGLAGVLGVQMILVILAAWILRDTAGARSAAVSVGEGWAASEVLVLRGWLAETVLGPRVAGMLAAVNGRLLTLVGLLVAAGLGWWCWRRRFRLAGQAAAGFGVLALGMALLSLTRTAYLGELAQLELPRHDRYLTVPSLLLLVALGLLLAEWASTHPGKSRWGGGLLAGLLLSGWGAWSHWARAPEHFSWSDAVPAVADFQVTAQKGTAPASLYVPNDVPYWGIVLEAQGGLTLPPETGIRRAVQIESDEAAWLGDFRVISPTEIEHEKMGLLRYTGTELGRVWFQDETGRQWFTSPLLQPWWWRIDGLEMTLVMP